MKHEENANGNNSVRARLLTDADMDAVSGGITGCTSIRCKKCGKAFEDMDQYRTHILQGHKPATNL